MLAKIKKYARKNRGAVLVEYVIILSFVAAIAAAIGLNNDDGLKGTAAQAAADAKTNLTNALGGSSSTIRDTDMATEMVEYSKNNILQQAGTSMLSQANESNSEVLSLLG